MVKLEGGQKKGHPVALPVRQIDYVAQVLDILNTKGHKNGFTGSKLKRFFWIGGFWLLVELHRKGSAHSLRSRLVYSL